MYVVCVYVHACTCTCMCVLCVVCTCACTCSMCVLCTCMCACMHVCFSYVCAIPLLVSCYVDQISHIYSIHITYILCLVRHWDGEVGPPPSRAGSKRFVSNSLCVMYIQAKYMFPHKLYHIPDLFHHIFIAFVL